MTDFLKQTPAQAAGLVAGGPTPDDVLLWETFKQSPVAAAFRADRAAAQLARRRELLAARDLELKALHSQAIEINRAKDACALRLKHAESELREAIAASRQLPMWAPESTPALDSINRELLEILDPRLNQLIGWVDFEDEVTSAYAPAPVFEDIRTNRAATTRKVRGDPETQQTIGALLQRRAALRAARLKFEAMKFEALDETEFAGAVDKVLSTIPELPSGVSQIGPLPRTLSSAEGLNEAQRATRKAVSTVATQHQHARAARAKGWFGK